MCVAGWCGPGVYVGVAEAGVCGGGGHGVLVDVVCLSGCDGLVGVK